MKYLNSIPKLVSVAIVIEFGLFAVQWFLQYLAIGGLFRDISFVAGSFCLLAWISGRLASTLPAIPASSISLGAVWGWGYLLLPTMRAAIEATLGALPWSELGVSLRGTISAFLSFSVIAIFIAVSVAVLVRLRMRGQT